MALRMHTTKINRRRSTKKKKSHYSNLHAVLILFLFDKNTLVLPSLQSYTKHRFDIWLSPIPDLHRFLEFFLLNFFVSIKYLPLVLQVTELRWKDGSLESSQRHLSQVPPYSPETTVLLKNCLFHQLCALKSKLRLSPSSWFLATYYSHADHWLVYWKWESRSSEAC
jgi:hypothetical protein